MAESLQAEVDCLGAALVVGSPARAQLLLDLEGADDEPPMALTLACRARGVSIRTVEEAIGRGALPDVEAARARGIQRCVRKAMAAEDPKAWLWLAERLAPKVFHLAHKVTGVAPEDGGAPIATDIRVTLELAQAGARDDYEGPLALPKPKGEP